MARISGTRWDVIDAAQGGDTEALDALLRKYRPAVVTYLERRGVGAEAEDVAQEVMTALTTDALAKTDASRGRFRSFVFVITRNVLAKHRARRQALKRGGGRVGLLGEADAEVAAPGEPDADFDEVWVLELVKRGLEDLARVHPENHAALSRFLLAQESQAEVAEALGLTTNAVKKRVFRGRQHLYRYLRRVIRTYTAEADELEAELAFLDERLKAHGW